MKNKTTKDVKSIAFSRLEPMDRAIYHHSLRQGNFSRYIKRLIEKDMMENRPPTREEMARYEEYCRIQKEIN